MSIHSKYLRALGAVILTSASIHLVILGYQFIKTGEVKIINYFNIIDLDLLFPQILELPAIHFVSIVPIITLYLLFLHLFKDS